MCSQLPGFNLLSGPVIVHCLTFIFLEDKFVVIFHVVAIEISISKEYKFYDSNMLNYRKLCFDQPKISRKISFFLLLS